MIAVRFFHLAVVRHGDLHLRVGGFIEEREEGDEVLVFDDGLLQARSAAFLVIGVADRQLGFGQIFAVRIGVDQGLQGQASGGVAAFLQVRHGLGVENFVRFDGSAGDGSGGVLFTEAPGEQRGSQCDEAYRSTCFQR